MNKMDDEAFKELYRVCTDFIKKQNIFCEETIYQSDRVIENAYELIENICNITGYVDSESNEDD